MSHAITLHLPVETPYRGLAGDVAAKFAESAGGSPAEAQAFGTKVLAGIEALVASGVGLDLLFERETAGVLVTIRCGQETRLIQQALPATRP